MVRERLTDQRSAPVRLACSRFGITPGFATGRLLFHMLGAIAQFETELRAERQRDGVLKAKAQGIPLGRRESLTPQQVAELRDRREQGVPIRTLMREFTLSKASIYRYLDPGQAADPMPVASSATEPQSECEVTHQSLTPTPAWRELVQPIRSGAGKKVHLTLPEGASTTLCGREVGRDVLKVALFPI
jgi:hypothetical protein